MLSITSSQECSIVQLMIPIVEFISLLSMPFKVELKDYLLSCLLRQARHILDRFCFGLWLLQAPN